MPTIKATLGQIRAAYGDQLPDGEFIPGPLFRLNNVPLPIAKSHWIGRTLEAAEAEWKKIEASRTELVKKHGEQIPDTERWQVPGKNLSAYWEEFSELLAEETDIPGRTFTVDELDGVQLSGFDLRRLQFLIVEPDAEAPPAPVAEIAEKRKAKKAA